MIINMKSAIFIYPSAIIETISGKEYLETNLDFKFNEKLIEQIILFEESSIGILTDNKISQSLSKHHKQLFEQSLLHGLSSICASIDPKVETFICNIDDSTVGPHKYLSVYKCAVENDIHLASSLFIGKDNEESDKHAKFAKEASIGEYLDINEIQ